MTPLRSIGIAVWFAFTVFASCALEAKAASNLCDSSLTRNIPARSPQLSGGSRFAAQLAQLAEDEREKAIRNELLAGNLPPHLRHLKAIEISRTDVDGKVATVTACVMPDYLAIGSDDDFFLVPMRLETALEIAERFGFSLPTRKLVDAIHAQSIVHLAPQPLPAGPAMRSTLYFQRHNDLVRGQLAEFQNDPGALISGDKKDLVLTNRLWTHLQSVAIYGWHQLDGRPIQPLSTVHGWRYVDYSHGVRLVSDKITVNGRRESFYRALENPALSSVLSDEGAIQNGDRLVHTLIHHRSDPKASNPQATRAL